MCLQSVLSILVLTRDEFLYPHFLCCAYQSLFHIVPSCCVLQLYFDSFLVSKCTKECLINFLMIFRWWEFWLSFWYVRIYQRLFCIFSNFFWFGPSVWSVRVQSLYCWYDWYMSFCLYDFSKNSTAITHSYFMIDIEFKYFCYR